jgi:two-component system, chemotaxis family, CheB/CheR fusion protein
MLYANRIVAAFDGLALNIAILDPAGNIVYVNPAWRRFAVENDCLDPTAYLGFNYLDVCEKSSASGDTLAQAAHAGIAKVFSGKAQDFRFVYPCHAPDAKRWFMMTVSKCHYGSDIVIAHDDVTLLFCD